MIKYEGDGQVVSQKYHGLIQTSKNHKIFWLVVTFTKKSFLRKNLFLELFCPNHAQLRWITDNWNYFRRYLGKYDIKWIKNTYILRPFSAYISIYYPIWQRIPKSKLQITTMGNLESLVVILAYIYAFRWFNMWKMVMMLLKNTPLSYFVIALQAKPAKCMNSLWLTKI